MTNQVELKEGMEIVMLAKPKMTRKEKQSKAKQIIALSKEGRKAAYIAKEVGVPVSYVYGVRSKNGLGKRPSSPSTTKVKSLTPENIQLKVNVKELQGEVDYLNNELDKAHAINKRLHEENQTLRTDLSKAHLAWVRTNGVIDYLEKKLASLGDDNADERNDD
jgi:hypothetical protein